VPDVDVPFLTEAGVATVLGPGSSAEDIVEAIRSAAQRTVDG
jgi:methylmalonyl-CoA mutase cobalamin-binding subunit